MCVCHECVTVGILRCSCRSLDLVVRNDTNRNKRCCRFQLIPDCWDWRLPSVNEWIMQLWSSLVRMSQICRHCDDCQRWAFSIACFFRRRIPYSVWTPLPLTPNDLFDQISRKGVTFGTLVQKFSTPPPASQNFKFSIFCSHTSTKVVHWIKNIGSANPMLMSVLPNNKGFPHFGLSQFSKTNSLIFQ